jgi:uncharacterized protein (TIGR00255 family)
LAIEIRSVNNRYLKLTLRAPEPYNLLEAEFDKVVRRFIRRGTLQIHVHADWPHEAQQHQLNTAALRDYVNQVTATWATLDPATRPNLDALLAGVLELPGVAPEAGADASHLEQDWLLIERVLTEALERLQAMRREEGSRMTQELLLYRTHVADQLELIRGRMTQVIGSYRDRLLERVRGLLTDSGVNIETNDLIREVSIFAERSDIAEEAVRLASHLEQFEQTVRTEIDSPGRKLEFLVQEMGRETNTIGSKASDVAISRHVVEIKATLEKVRELIQNVE